MEKAKRATIQLGDRLITWRTLMDQDESSGSEEENIHAAVSEGDCRRMAKRNHWTLKETRDNGDPILSVDCIFEGKQTSFEDTTYD